MAESQTTSVVDQVNEPIHPRMISTRRGPGGRQVPFVKYPNLIRRMNAIFGPLGYDLTLPHGLPRRTTHGKDVIYSCVVEVAVPHEDWIVRRQGVGSFEARRSREERERGDPPTAEACSNAEMAAESIATKRAARSIGEAFGLRIYGEDNMASAGEAASNDNAGDNYDPDDLGDYFADDSAKWDAARDELVAVASDMGWSIDELNDAIRKKTAETGEPRGLEQQSLSELQGWIAAARRKQQGS